MPTDPKLPVCDDEPGRLRALAECNVLDTEREPVFDALVVAATRLCEVPIALVSLVDEQRQWFKARIGVDAQSTDRRPSFCSHAILSHEPMVVEDATKDGRFADNGLVTGPPHIRFYAGVPLELSSGERLGSLCVIDRRPRTLTSDQHRDLQVLGKQAAAMLELRRTSSQLEICNAEQAELIEQLKTSQTAAASAKVTIFSLARLAESRDPETGAHLERVQTYCRVLAEHLRVTKAFGDQIDETFVELIHNTSPLHDIGKVAIPDHVLLKPGRLSEEEFAIMENHARVGAETLEAAIEQYPHARFLHMARDIALTHHEKCNGTGYPNQLAGEAIPLAGRIMAVADVYDALTSKRVYKGAYSHAIARDIIQKDSGKHFDPAVVDAFTACGDEFEQIAAMHAAAPKLAA
jgi:response regulator RpfG family c-di-GMP phosphodiesterase